MSGVGEAFVSILSAGVCTYRFKFMKRECEARLGGEALLHPRKSSKCGIDH